MMLLSFCMRASTKCRRRMCLECHVIVASPTGQTKNDSEGKRSLMPPMLSIFAMPIFTLLSISYNASFKESIDYHKSIFDTDDTMRAHSSHHHCFEVLLIKDMKVRSDGHASCTWGCGRTLRRLPSRCR